MSAGGSIEGGGTAAASGGASSGGDGTYYSPYDFTVVRKDADELTLSGLPFLPEVTDFKEVVHGQDATAFVSILPTGSAYTWTPNSPWDGGGTLLVDGATFASGDTFSVTVWGPPKALSLPEDTRKVAEQQPLWSNYTDAQELISAAQDFTGSWADLGPEVDCRGYNNVRIWLTIDVNNSLDMRVRALVKHESGGVEEYTLPIETYGASDIKVEDAYWEFNVDADQLMVLELDVGNTIPFLQFQIEAGTVGVTAGQVDAAYVTKGWK